MITSIWQRNLKLEIFGASHAAAIGMHLTGIPAGVTLDFNDLQQFLIRRAPGRNVWSTTRVEPDMPEFIAGLNGVVTDGSVITAVIKNQDFRSRDYQNLKTVPRPGHADYPAAIKYHGQLDLSGGGPFSGRMTAPLCIAGAIAKQILAAKGIFVGAHIKTIGSITSAGFCPVNLSKDQLLTVAKKAFPVVNDEIGIRMQALIAAVQTTGDSVGGAVECAVVGLPVGLGGPLFDGLESRMTALIFGIPGVRGVEFGAGFAVTTMSGSQNNDEYYFVNKTVMTKTNHHGGVLGGMTTGMPLVFNVALKPTSSIAKPQNSVDLATGQATVLAINGRHDPCFVPRVVPCVEAAAAICVLDLLLEAGVV